MSCPCRSLYPILPLLPCPALLALPYLASVNLLLPVTLFLPLLTPYLLKPLPIHICLPKPALVSLPL